MAASYSDWFNSNVDPRLLEILSKSAEGSPYGVTFTSGRAARRGNKGFHPRGQAVDLRLIDRQSGKAIPNYQNAGAFRVYEEFAQKAKGVQSELYPELNDKFRWGGYFSGPKGKYGALDLMHFDLGGATRMGGGSWDQGLTEAQRRLWPNAVSAGMSQQPPAVAAWKPPPERPRSDIPIPYPKPMGPGMGQAPQGILAAASSNPHGPFPPPGQQQVPPQPQAPPQAPPQVPQAPLEKPFRGPVMRQPEPQVAQAVPVPQPAPTGQPDPKLNWKGALGGLLASLGSVSGGDNGAAAAMAAEEARRRREEWARLAQPYGPGSSFL